LETKIKSERGLPYFIMRQDNDLFVVELCSSNTQSPDKYISSSNRKLKIGNSLFPLILDYDHGIGIGETPGEILASAKATKYFSYTLNFMTGEPFYIKFNNAGIVEYAGQ
jgi:hypothetical protein